MLRALRLLVATSVPAGTTITSPLHLFGQSAFTTDPAPQPSAQDNSVVVDVDAEPVNEPHLAWQDVTLNGFASLCWG